jgi:hypothetical protein
MDEPIVKEEWMLMAEYEGITNIQEAKLTYAERKKLPSTAFCGPNRSYPAHDAAHVRNGLARLSQHGGKLKPTVRARIMGCLRSRAKRFGVQVGETQTDKAPILNWFLEEHGYKNLVK